MSSILNEAGKKAMQMWNANNASHIYTASAATDLYPMPKKLNQQPS